MNERSRPARRLPNDTTTGDRSRSGGRIAIPPSRRPIGEQREHELDRMAAAATYRAQRAREGTGYRFELPPSLRRATA